MHVFTCPYCRTRNKVGHLEWSAITCLNQKCNRPIHMDVEIMMDQVFSAVFKRENKIEEVLEEIS